MVRQVVESIVHEFSPDCYRDTYQEQMQELVDAELECE